MPPFPGLASHLGRSMPDGLWCETGYVAANRRTGCRMDTENTPANPPPKCRRCRLWLLLVLAMAGMGAHRGLRRMQAGILESESPYVMKQILVALCIYADENGGQFPPENGVAGLRRLIQPEGLDPANLTWFPQYPVATDSADIQEENTSYYYLGGYSRESPPNTIILIEKPFPHRKKTRVGLADGRVTSLEEMLAP